MSIGVVVVGFILLYIYDFNSISVRCPVMQTFFFGGSTLILLGTLSQIVLNLSHIVFGVRLVLCALFFVFSFALLVYTLFFALPFDDTYKGSTSEICDTGIYALCRHPGVLWFLLMYISLCGMCDDTAMVQLCIVANLLNFIYIILQDWIIFPKTFDGYTRYQKCVPFLIPNTKSIKHCVDTIRG